MAIVDVIDAKEIIKNQRSFFNTQKTKDIKFRKSQLRLLKSILTRHESEFFQALKRDLGKSEYESFGSEIAQVKDEINFTLKNLNYWSAPERVPAAWVSFPSRHYIYSEAYGVVFIIGAWNYPVLLTLSPLVGAIAAGNCAIVKPSELSINTSHLLANLFSKYFDPCYLKIAEGGPDVNQDFLHSQIDYIFFTGSPRVGKIVMKAAAENLVPVTLELGGKSPCIVDEDANLKISARRVLFGKMLNAGQTCIAPDFLLVHEKVKEKFLDLLTKRIDELYGENPLAHEDIGNIVNENHFNRLIKYLSDGNIVKGGQFDKESLKIAPTLIDGISWDDAVMQEEIFGPVMPIISFTDLEATIRMLNEMEKPLAAYYFSSSKKKQEEIIKKLKFGGGVMNDAIFHFGNPELPIGGIGNSGMGRYHGKYSFDTFSHKKSIVKKPYYLDLSLRYPPFKNKLKFLRWIFKL